MTNALTQLPSGSPNFGHEFNYAVWTPGTNIMLANVPWNSDYRDIVSFANDAALTDYLTTQSGPIISLDKLMYAKPGHPIRINLPFNRVYKYNYLRAFNAAQPVPGGDSSRALYYFILDVRYIAPNTTELVVQLDVWQSFSKNVTFGNCFIERGHIGIANTHSFDDHGRAYLTVPEGMDVGNEYVIQEQWENDLVDLRAPDLSLDDLYGVVIASTIKLDGDYGNIDNPKLASATGSLFERLPNGCELYYFDNPSDFTYFQLHLSDFPWIAQGIQSVTVVPRLTNVTLPAPIHPFPANPLATEVFYDLFSISQIPREQLTIKSGNFRDSVNLGRYSKLKKFLTYPYTIVELTTFSGNPLVLKPECINTDGLYVNKLMHLAPPNPRIVFSPKGYNAAAGDNGQYSGEFLDVTTGIFDLPQFSIVNNGYLTYMASNRNAIQYQHSSADWSQQRALMGANLSASQADLGIGLNNQRNSIANKQALSQMQNANSTLGWRSAQHAGNSLIDGIETAAGGNVVGGALNAVQGGANAAADYAIGSNDNIQRNAIDMNARNQGTRVQNDYAAGMRDTNRTYAEVAAQGDYSNTIAGINAKVQDAKLIPPTTSGQIGGDGFNLSAYKWTIAARLKVLQPAAMRAIGEYWLRYGYAVNQFGRMPSSFQVMDNFTYWKLRETYITASTCPEMFKQTIRGIFEKGVTVWADPSKIGNIDIADNDPLTGVTL